MSVNETAKRVEKLAAALSDTHVSAAWNAARELAKMGAGGRAGLPALLKAMDSRDQTTALWARFATAVITEDIESQLPYFIAALAEKKRIWPGMAATALSGFGPAAAPAAGALADDLQSSRTDDRWAAAWALGSIGAGAAEGAPALISALEDADEKVRWYSAWAIGRIGSAPANAIPALTRALEDTDDDVRGYAAIALGRLGANESDVGAKIKLLLEDDNPEVQRAAEAALTELADRRSR